VLPENSPGLTKQKTTFNVPSRGWVTQQSPPKKKATPPTPGEKKNNSQRKRIEKNKRGGVFGTKFSGRKALAAGCREFAGKNGREKKEGLEKFQNWLWKGACFGEVNWAGNEKNEGRGVRPVGKEKRRCGGGDISEIHNSEDLGVTPTKSKGRNKGLAFPPTEKKAGDREGFGSQVKDQTRKKEEQLQKSGRNECQGGEDPKKRSFRGPFKNTGGKFVAGDMP